MVKSSNKALFLEGLKAPNLILICLEILFETYYIYIKIIFKIFKSFLTFDFEFNSGINAI